jgi:multidrug efflux pump subunit AcrB
VEYVYATSLPDAALVTVRFRVGADQERSLVRLYDAMAGSMDRMPPGASSPLVRARLIDDVPFLTLTLWDDGGDERLLRDLAAALEEEVRSVPEVSATRILGGRRRAVDVRLDAAALAAAGIPADQVIDQLARANVALPAGEVVGADRAVLVRTDAFLRSPEDVASLVVGVVDGRAMRLGSLARIADGAEVTEYVARMAGAGNADAGSAGGASPAVTLALAKRKGADATRVAESVLHRVDSVRGMLLPTGVHLEVTRNFGETANEKANDLLRHLGIAIVSVTVLVALVLGARGSAVVFISVPVTFALTLFIYYLFGYTLNRVTLFALIFVTGIVVDDSIIVVENISRHLALRRGGSLRETLLTAVSEVGNPTVLATLTVIASVLPMAYVGGLMGPYMRPMPVGASLAMTFSLVVALTMAPWLGKRLLRAHAPEAAHAEAVSPRLRRLYDRLLGPLLDRPRRGLIMLAVIGGLLGGSLLLIPLKAVTVKMLPFDNKSEIEVLLDLPEGTPLEDTYAAAREVAGALAALPEVTGLEIYAGGSSPITFNGLVRHYDLRRGPEVAGIHVTLLPKGRRDRKSHELAAVLRERALPSAQRHRADLKVVEVPPGPPVLSTLVAEIYGPDERSRLALAAQVKAIFESTPGVVDVDWMVDAPQRRWDVTVDRTRAALAGVAPASVARSLRLALSGEPAGLLHPAGALEDVPITVSWSREDRSSLLALGDLRVPDSRGGLVPVSAVSRSVPRERETAQYRKNGIPVVYVLGDVAGRQESPVYAILDMKDRISGLRGVRGEPVRQLFADRPTPGGYAVKWDGEWQITLEVFRDLGLAFGAVLILIYMLIAGWFQDLKKPLIMMAAIPLSLVGILPGHWILGGFFTATSMIGFIALAGIMVRNGILLLDFVDLARARGLGLREALLEAGAVRFRPIVLTAGTVVIGAMVILFDPIFQGLAISLMAGSIASTVLTLIVVPILFYRFEVRREAKAAS